MNTILRSVAGLAWLLAPLIVTVSLLVGSTVAQAETPIKLSLRQAAGQGGNFILTMAPGEIRQLQVQLGNGGSETVRTRTFPSDVYTLVNGGFGIKLDGEPTGGTTTWLSYPVETINIEPGASVVRTFTVSVPSDTKPGEYLTSLVLQNAAPVADDGVKDGVGVSFNQIVRQALAISITLPGPLTPSFQIGEATQEPLSNRTTVAVQVKNTGNVRLKPYGEFVLVDVSGKELSRYPIKMDTVYAGTTTTAEMPFDQLLNPGEYIVVASLSDASGATAASGPLALSVPQPDASGGVADAGPGRATLNQAPVGAEARLPSMSQDNSLPIALGAGGLLMVLLGVGGFLLYRRRQAELL